MPATSPPIDAESLGPVLADLGLGPGAVRVLGSALAAPPAEGLLLSVSAGAPPQESRHACLDAFEEELADEGTLLLFVAGAPDDAELAAWRNALWPSVHVVGLYRCSPTGIARQTLQGREALPGSPAATGVLLVGRRREYVMSPKATTEKFDLNAVGWNGRPGAAGYAHFRWMRRFVADFAERPDARRILDFGCGAGWVGIEAAKRCEDAELCSFDPSPEMVRITGENAAAEGIRRFTGRTGFGEAPPFPAAGEPPFDLVLSSGVVSFSPDVERWLDGLAGAVATGGTLVVGDIHRGSRGMRARRRTKPLLPVREMNAQVRADVRAGLEARGFEHERSAGYQLTTPVPQAMHWNETRLKGLLTWPLLVVNRASAALDRSFGSPAQNQFDSWVMRFRASSGR